MGVQNRLKFQPIKAQLMGCQVHYLQDIYPSLYLIQVSSKYLYFALVQPFPFQKSLLDLYLELVLGVIGVVGE